MDLLAGQGTHESFPAPQLKSINSLVLSFLCSPVFTSIHNYWKTIAWTRLTFIGKVVSLLFNMLVIAFLPRSKRLLMSWLNLPSAVILDPQNKVSHCFPLFPHLLAIKLWDQMPWRRKWQPTPVFLPRESQGQRSLVGCHLWGRTESDMTEAT